MVAKGRLKTTYNGRALQQRNDNKNRKINTQLQKEKKKNLHKGTPLLICSEKGGVKLTEMDEDNTIQESHRVESKP